MGTLTSIISKPVHALISLIFLYKSCSIATAEHSKPLLLENYVDIVALSPNLQRVSIHCATELLYHSSTIELLLSLIFIKGVLSKL
jgi:hypothetical protein